MAQIAGSPDLTITDKPLVSLKPGTIPRAVDMQVDVLVVGLGPGGLIALREFAKQGFTCLGIDRKQELGWPKRCAEGVSDEGLAFCGVKPDPAWAYGRIEGAALYAPNGKRVVLEDESTYGWVVERKIFEKHLARDAILAGGKIMVKTQAVNLLRDSKGAVAGVRAEFMWTQFNIRAKLTIGADGIDSF
ncbi:MAG: NAD(P)/FAD-dependent oxidoreductase, partial [Candidatus Thermoplasmatota archaeon]